MKRLNVVIFALALSACGGGSGKLDAQPTSSSTSTEINAPVEEMTRMEQLSVGQDFDFISGQNLRVTIDWSGPFSGRTAINVCTDFSAKSDNYKIDHESCVLRAQLHHQYQEYFLKLSPGDKTLIAQVWRLEEGAEPDYFLWQQSIDGMSWQITIN